MTVNFQSYNIPVISVIVPVYNAEKWLDKCIASILAQTFQDFELILVDDGSSDKSPHICDRHGQTDQRIRIIHESNGGASEARAAGVRIAKGEFIFFTDSDDSLERECLECLFNVIKSRNNVDIVICNQPENQIGYLDIESYRRQCIDRTIYPAPWGKLFRRNLFNDRTFDIERDIIVGEDLLMNIRCAFEARHGVYLLGKHLYNYNDHAQNTMNRFKRTPEYEAKFIKLIAESMPIGGGNSQYMKACNAYAFQILLEVFDNKINLNDKREWIKSDFYNTLFSNIKKYGNPTTRFGLAKIKYTSVFARFIIFLPSYLKRSLKRQ